MIAQERQPPARGTTEIDHAFEIVSIIQRRAGRVEPDETIQRGIGLVVIGILVLRVGFLQLGLLRQGSACGTAFEHVVQLYRLIVAT